MTPSPDTPAAAAGPPDPQRFRDAMAALAATTCLVSAAGDGRRTGRIVTAAFSLAVEPPSVLVSIRADSELAAVIGRTGGLSFAMLGEVQRPVAEAFAGGTPAEQRFRHGDWRAWPSGHPRLLGAVACMDCTVSDEAVMAGHRLFAAVPRRIDFDKTRAPLVWHDRRFCGVRPL
ncbi:flavin reductase [Oceanicella sp. SM1341]|uniref:flavin reductase n=1 Tax=Oceanicella sp. SM1341 TaxID=1548889 RepID=UPI000E47FD8B|nr:flavin reductase [Oceanicella sp. SM1341]